MRKIALIIVIFELCTLLVGVANQSFAASPACLENDLTLDFSQTQFSFIGPMESWFVFKFKVTNIGTKNLLIHSNSYCEENLQLSPICAPQGDTPLAPGESMWFKMVLEAAPLGYDPNVPQTINRTLHMDFFDLNNNWAGSDNSFSVIKTIQITVVAQTLQGNVAIQGVTVDEEGTSIPNVNIDVGGYGAKVPMQSDAAGHFSFFLAESPVYFLIAQKEGYRATTIEVDRNHIQQSYTITLTREQTSVSINAVLMKSVEGNIGFWRDAATADESKLLLVNGMENWEDESLKTQSKLYLLDTNTGETTWTSDMGWESWSADITDNGEFVVFGTQLAGFQTGPAGFVNYIRLLNGADGSTIWEKQITTQNFPNSTQGEFFTRSVKFSHSGDDIFVPVHYEYCYLLNRVDGSIIWSKWVGSEVREVIFTEDDQYMYIPCGGGWLYKVRVADGSEVWKQWIGSWPYVNGFDLSPNEQYLAVGTKGGCVSVINTADGSIRFTADVHNGRSTCVFSPDSTKVLVGGDLLTMYDLNGNALWRYYHDGSDIRFSADGKLIFTSNGAVLDSYGTLLYDILSGSDRSTKVGWINSDATRYIYAVQDTGTLSEKNIIEVYRVETSAQATPVPTVTPVATATPVITPQPTIAPNPTATPTPTQAATPTLSPSPTPMDSPSPSITPNNTPTIAPSTSIPEVPSGIILPLIMAATALIIIVQKRKLK